MEMAIGIVFIGIALFVGISIIVVANRNIHSYKAAEHVLFSAADTKKEIKNAAGSII
jgi:hypothetical protein